MFTEDRGDPRLADIIRAVLRLVDEVGRGVRKRARRHNIASPTT
jgi:hypothetical protein